MVVRPPPTSVSTPLMRHTDASCHLSLTAGRVLLLLHHWIRLPPPKLALWIWHGEDRGHGEPMLEVLEHFFSLGGPANGNLGGGKSMERSSYCAEAKLPVIVRKS